MKKRPQTQKRGIDATTVAKKSDQTWHGDQTVVGLITTLVKLECVYKVAGRVLRVHHSTICLFSRPGGEAFFLNKTNICAQATSPFSQHLAHPDQGGTP